MAFYKVAINTVSRRGPGTSWPMGIVFADFEFEPVEIRNGWLAIRYNKWIHAGYCVLIYDTPPDPPPAEDGIYKTFIGRNKPYGYLPEGTNYGSFSIMWLLPEEPANVINKPAGFNLEKRHIEWLERHSDAGWLVSQRGTDKVLSVDEAEHYRCPVPCCSENNPVKVLEWGARAVRIATVSIYESMPEELPDYLCHKWYAYTKGGAFYMVQGASGGVKYPLFARSNSAWIQRKGIIE